MEFKRKGREKDYYKEWYEKNKKHNLERVSLWYKAHKEEVLEKHKINYKLNPKKVIEATHNWQKNNREKYNAWARNWAKNNREKINKKVAFKKLNDINYKLKNDYRKRIHTSLIRNYKKGKSLEYLGCTIPELKIHLEKQFKPGMNWNNHKIKGWHIDHIKPICNFNFKNEEEIKKALHFTNLQPLWAKENWKKNRY